MDIKIDPKPKTLYLKLFFVSYWIFNKSIRDNR